MILPMLLALQEAPPPVPPEDEIIVIARKMRFIDVAIRAPRRRGQLVLQRCRVIRPSGHAVLDAIPCDAAHQCMFERPTSRKALLRCIEARSNARVDEIVATRTRR